MIFKKHISILLTFFLLVSNLGLAFNVHYCDDKIASITLNSVPARAQVVDECCGVVENNSGCCKDKVIKAEIKSDQIIVKTAYFETNFLVVDYYSKPEFSHLNCSLQKTDKLTYYCDAHAPPLYLLYSQYTFYA
jgi:TATA-binding protein-associated factor Taf7